MKSALRMLLSAGLLSVGAGVGHSFADHEVNNLWWGLISGYNGSHRTACVAENYNSNPVNAVFELFPARFDFKGNPVPGRAFIYMKPYIEYQIYIWPEGFSRAPQCNLRSYSVYLP